MRWWSPVSRRRSRSQLGEWRSTCWSKIEGNGCFRQEEEQISGFPRQRNGKEPACQCRRCRRSGFCPWVGKIPWSRKWHPILVFLPEKFNGQRSLAGCSHGVTKSQTPLSDWTELVLTIVNSAAMNIRMHVSSWIMIFRDGTAGSYSNFIFSF